MAGSNGRGRSLEDYITVAERIQTFYAKHPSGTLQSEVIFDDGKRVVVKASAYRSVFDKRPGIGHAEEIRGEGPVNKASAMENAETSAWGRALAALGLEVQKGVASREEVEHAQAETKRQAALITGEDAAKLLDHYLAAGIKPDALKMKLGAMGVAGVSSVNGALAKLTPAQAAELDAWMVGQGVAE